MRRFTLQLRALGMEAAIADRLRPGADVIDPMPSDEAWCSFCSYPIATNPEWCETLDAAADWKGPHSRYCVVRCAEMAVLESACVCGRPRGEHPIDDPLIAPHDFMAASE